MSHWDSQNLRIVRWPTIPYGKRGWLKVDCGCCNGTEWGGEEPRECQDCGGMGVLALHKKSRALALYPGGPFVGRGAHSPRSYT